MPPFWNSSNTAGDEWSNIILDSGLEDVDTAQFQKGSDELLQPKLQLKEAEEDETFFPNSFDVLDRPQFGFSPSLLPEPLSPSSSVETSKPCPCCHIDIDLEATNFQTHVSRCFLESAKAPAKPMTEKLLSESVQAIRQSVSALDLHQRISLIESLARLSRSGSAALDEHQPPLSTRAIEADHFLFSLLFSKSIPKPTTPTPRAPSPPSFAKSPHAHKELGFPESVTPTMSPSSPTFNPANSPMNINKYAFSSGSRQHFRQPAKRKRDVVQALSFEPANSKIQRVEAA
eukprot:CAMPEP_0175113068 /NCGR_PEP_ID=MMETSP0086_2-20121207/15917_1 /TAXON_ID=136419 /ORGANISM="Unknown Unknown, Strain D1" /LENGTH=287 /DNA_ID=CAMNT_0016392209 /DNA_START=60 /DNA_END=923 /DNA_ORIENTATION=-